VHETLFLKTEEKKKEKKTTEKIQAQAYQILMHCQNNSQHNEF